tara:strand:- start:3561 stop:4394 length:834 start_codon:yes stop_codon:yes gene_type:complete
MSPEEKKYLFETHLFYKKILELKSEIQNNPYDTNYRIIISINDLNKSLSKIESYFVENVNSVLVDKLFYNFDYKSLEKRVLNDVFYNDISEIILDYTNLGDKLIFIKLTNRKNMIIVKKIDILKNLIKYEFVTDIYIEKYDLYKGMVFSDFKKFTPVYSFENLTFIPTNPNVISKKIGIYNLIMVDINFSIISKRSKKINKKFYISSIEQLNSIENFINDNKSYYFCNFNLYSIKTVERNFLHNIYLNLPTIEQDVFTKEIYVFLINLLIKTNKPKF